MRLLQSLLKFVSPPGNSVIIEQAEKCILRINLPQKMNQNFIKAVSLQSNFFISAADKSLD